MIPTNLVLILFLFFSYGSIAQTKGKVEIVKFFADTTIHYEIEDYNDRIEFQIEKLNEKGEWSAVFTSAYQCIVSGVRGSNIKNDYKPMISGKYRLKITYPAVIISKELEFKK